MFKSNVKFSAFSREITILLKTTIFYDFSLDINQIHVCLRFEWMKTILSSADQNLIERGGKSGIKNYQLKQKTKKTSKTNKWQKGQSGDEENLTVNMSKI